MQTYIRGKPIVTCEGLHKQFPKSRRIFPQRQFYPPIMLGFSWETDVISSVAKWDTWEPAIVKIALAANEDTRWLAILLE
jgi:hypothetical protein